MELLFQMTGVAQILTMLNNSISSTARNAKGEFKNFMKTLKTVGEFRKLLENFEDDWIIQLELLKESDSPGLINPFYTKTLNVQNQILDICHSERLLTIMVYAGGSE